MIWNFKTLMKTTIDDNEKLNETTWDDKYFIR